MKAILFFIALVSLFCAPLVAGDVAFAFDYGTPMPTGFEIRLSTTPGGPAVRTFDCGAAPAKTCTIPGVASGSYYSRAFAYNVSTPASLGVEYSAGSNEVAFIVAATPPAPAGHRIIGKGTASVTFKVPPDQMAKIELSFSPKQ